MIFPLARRYLGPLLGTIRSFSSKVTGGGSRGYGTGMSARSNNGGGPGAGGREHFRLEENKNPRRGLGPRTANPITNFTFSESEERIVQPDQGGAATVTSLSGDGGGVAGDGKGIMKEVMVRVTEERKSRSGFPDEEFGSPGDYYLTQQVRRSEEAPRRGTLRKDKRGSVGFVRG